ncbi:ERV/ALR sulfhydryl oxidase domain-containing protein [Flagelloscypha sp. PMI_526]|nr:ERV/ALR sulfhydryl oxidase domain-containing protein [Flagelloscypha sp. PMI_526]
MISRFAKAFVAIVATLLLLATIGFMHPPTRSYIDPWTGELFSDATLAVTGRKGHIGGVHGDVIMPKLGNATAKAALGRSTWKLLHTMTLRYPEHPTEDEREAFESYFHLLSRLYPCGECATEFQQLLKKYPVQTSSRRSAATWLCMLHNQVNDRLQKPEFDCAHLDDEYDCGCGDEPVSGTPVAGASMINGGR